MSTVYKPRCTTSPQPNPARCKAAVFGKFVTHQCSRKAKQDGWCKQHHPDAEAERLRQQRERYEAKVARIRERVARTRERRETPLRELREENDALRAEVERLRDKLRRERERADKVSEHLSQLRATINHVF